MPDIKDTLVARGRIPARVSHRDNVGLYRRIRSFRCIAMRHEPLIEVTFGRVAVVTARRQNDRALLFHWLVCRACLQRAV